MRKVGHFSEASIITDAIISLMMRGQWIEKGGWDQGQMETCQVAHRMIKGSPIETDGGRVTGKERFEEPSVLSKISSRLAF